VASSSFLSFFPCFRRLISEVTEWILTKPGHIFTYDGDLKNLVRTPQRVYPPRTHHGLGQKIAFLGPTANFDQHNITTEHNINNRKETCQSTETTLHATEIALTLVQKRLRTVDEFLPTTYILLFLPVKLNFLSKEVCYKVSFCENFQRQGCTYIIPNLAVHRWIAGDVPST